MNRFFIFVIVLVLSLAACAPTSGVQMAAPTIIPPGEAGGPPMNTPGDEVKVVTLQVPATTQPTTAASPVPPLPTVTATSVMLPSRTLADLGLQLATYQDEQAGWAIDYPTGWIVTAPPKDAMQTATIYTVSFRSGTVTRLPKQQEGIPPGMTAIDVTVYREGGPKTLEQAIHERRAAATQAETGQTATTIISEEEWTLANGLIAHRFLFDLGSPGEGQRNQNASELVMLIQGHQVTVYGVGDMSLYNMIAASMRETK